MKRLRFYWKNGRLLLCICSLGLLLAGCSRKAGYGQETAPDAVFENSGTAGTGSATDTPSEESPQPSVSREQARLTFTTEDFLADYDYMWEVLEENYFYFPLLEDRGIEIEALKETTRRQLEERITTLDGFYYLLDFLFGRMDYFAHLSMVDPAVHAIYQKYYGGEGAGRGGWQKSLQNPRTQAVYEYLENSCIARTGQGRRRPGEIGAAWDADRGAIIFRISTFDDDFCERDRHFIKDYLATLAAPLSDLEINHIIFDLSGNMGGNDRYWMDNIVAPFGGSHDWTRWWYLRDTELTRSYFFHDFSPEPAAGSDHPLPAFVRELGLTHSVRLSQQLSSDVVLPENILSARRWVIVDNRVYSSADNFSAFCRATGWATLVGQPTLGDGGPTPVLVLLPRTGLLVRFSGVAVETPDGTLSAVTGTAPDIPVDPAKSSLDAINRLIDKESCVPTDRRDMP